MKTIFTLLFASLITLPSYAKDIVVTGLQAEMLYNAFSNYSEVGIGGSNGGGNSGGNISYRFHDVEASTPSITGDLICTSWRKEEGHIQTAGHKCTFLDASSDHKTSFNKLLDTGSTVITGIHAKTIYNALLNDIKNGNSNNLIETSPAKYNDPNSSLVSSQVIGALDLNKTGHFYCSRQAHEVNSVHSVVYKCSFKK